MTSAFSWQNSVSRLTCLYSKAKFAHYFRYLLTSYFCISVPYDEKDIFFFILSITKLFHYSVSTVLRYKIKRRKKNTFLVLIYLKTESLYRLALLSYSSGKHKSGIIFCEFDFCLFVCSLKYNWHTALYTTLHWFLVHIVLVIFLCIAILLYIVILLYNTKWLCHIMKI